MPSGFCAGRRDSDAVVSGGFQVETSADSFGAVIVD
jgi:hypothetical protein